MACVELTRGTQRWYHTVPQLHSLATAPHLCPRRQLRQFRFAGGHFGVEGVLGLLKRRHGHREVLDLAHLLCQRRLASVLRDGAAGALIMASDVFARGVEVLHNARVLLGQRLDFSHAWTRRITRSSSAEPRMG